MADSIRILDCTLRDGGRIINCNFGKERICGIVEGLQGAGIDIIELGFIRNRILYEEGTTFFTRFDQAAEYASGLSAETVLFVDYGMFDLEQIPLRSADNPITGIRYGFTKGHFKDAWNEMQEIMRRGYQLYVQGVDTLSYSTEELLEMIAKINQLRPHSFSIVDTYGAMYQEDVVRYFELCDKHLEKDILIDFHSHNNFQLSFSFAQEVVRLAQKSQGRQVIIDSTLYGMGKVAGNLNTELIISYLNRIHGCAYDLNMIFDTIDENIIDLYRAHPWGYSCDSLLSGIYRAHPNNVIYLTEKFKLDTNDVANILDMIGDKKRKSYDYGYIERCYISYNSSKQGDSEARRRLREVLSGKTVLIIAPGNSVRNKERMIHNFVRKNSPVVIGVNFEYDLDTEFSELQRYIFFANQKRYKRYHRKENGTQMIVTSNVRPHPDEQCYSVDYYSLIELGGKNFDNATIMLLKLLKDLDISAVYIAGFDGFRDTCNFLNEALNTNRNCVDYSKLNAEISIMFSKVKAAYHRKGIDIQFLTESIYDI